MESGPDLREIVRVFRAFIGSDWWIIPRGKDVFSEPGRIFAGAIKKWAVNLVESELGHRVYQVRVAFDKNTSIVLLKSMASGERYRVLYAAALDIVKIRKKITPTAALVFYGSMFDKNASVFDRIKPVMNRSFRARGYHIAAVKHGLAEMGRGKGSGADGNMNGLNGFESGKGLYRAHAGLEWREIIKCSKVEGSIVEKQSKWIIFLLIFISWKWLYYASYNTLLEEPDQELCDQIVGLG